MAELLVKVEVPAMVVARSVHNAPPFDPVAVLEVNARLLLKLIVPTPLTYSKPAPLPETVLLLKVVAPLRLIVPVL